MEERLEGKAAFVTGTASGIGKASALRLAQEGARVACTDINEEGLAATVAEIREAGGEALELPCDIADFDAVKEIVDRAASELGSIDVLVNVAGIGGFVKTHEESREHWEKVVNINLGGTFNTIRSAIEYLLESKGNVVNVASIAGVRAHPYAAAYCASKGGVVMLTKALALEYGPEGVRFNAVCPGGIKTPLLKNFAPDAVENSNMQLITRLMGVNGRFGQPEEIASTVAYLASDEASFMTGSIVVNDGGSTL
jgi:NAD(P)-dependent dehydrogenase (short-subunit alcohol dehydrogenase family)